jgi:hypothetical protein
MREVVSEYAPGDCKDCGGSGRNGTLCGYAVVCRYCLGRGQVSAQYGHWLDGTQGDDHGGNHG